MWYVDTRVWKYILHGLSECHTETFKCHEQGFTKYIAQLIERFDLANVGVRSPDFWLMFSLKSTVKWIAEVSLLFKMNFAKWYILSTVTAPYQLIYIQKSALEELGNIFKYIEKNSFTKQNYFNFKLFQSVILRHQCYTNIHILIVGIVTLLKNKLNW